MGSHATMTCYSATKPTWRKFDGEKFNYLIVKEHDGFSETIMLDNLSIDNNGFYRCKGRKRKKFMARSNLFVGG